MYHENETEEAVERRILKECQTVNLGRLGNRDGINVAKVEVQWVVNDRYEGGFYVVHATGVAPEAVAIYETFHELVHEAMLTKLDAGRIDGYEILDTYAY